ncbi:MAG TPA: hypothetical protein VG266_02230 [Candidatus Dormibacteraeota bacterium]|jgi:Flp pilus assembly pilin Flp|nr:hypothetical protein [Candidatus Dormibacteraeota bacterium]
MTPPNASALGPNEPAPQLETVAPDPRCAERGQGLVEYSLILVLIAIFVILAVQVLGTHTSHLYSNISNGLAQ